LPFQLTVDLKAVELAVDALLAGIITEVES
jgi:hypothetical protein